jgi:hypothetical protein
MSTRFLCAAASAIFVTAGLTSAATVSPTKLNGDFINGSGIPADQFTVATAGDGSQVALKARDRDTGEPISKIGSTYHVPAGLNGTNPAWTFDFQFAPGTAAPYGLKLDVDFDPGPGTSFRTIDLPVLGGWNSVASDGFYVNGAPVVFSDATPYVYSQSWHLGFTFWSTLPGGPTGYNPNLPGTYTINLTAYLPGTTAPDIIASTSINAVVDPAPAVPTPAAASAGLALLGALGLRRRSR